MSDSYRTPFLLFLGFVFSYFARYGFNVFFARLLGTAAYGQYAVAIRALTVIAPLTILGTSAASKRFVTQYITQKNNKLLLGYLFWNFRLFITSAITTTILTTVAIATMIALHLFDLKSILSYHLTFYFIYCAPVLALTLLISNILIAFRHFIFASYIANICPYLFMSLFLWLFWQADGSIHNIGIALVVFLAYIAVLVILFSYIFSIRSQIKAHATQKEIISKRQKKAWLITAKRFSLNNIVVSIIDAADVITIELLLHNGNLVGYYAAALTITKVIWLIRYGFNTFISISVADHFAKKEMLALENILKKISIQQIVITLLLCSTLFIFSSDLLNHFGKNFILAKTPLLILIISAGFTVILSPATMTLIYSGHEKFALRINIVTLICFIFICPLLTYLFGLIGAAITTAIGYLVPRMVGVIYARKKLHIKTCGFV